MNNVAITRREYAVPNANFAPRGECPSVLTPLYRETILPEGERNPIIHHYATLVLSHIAEDGRTKNSLPLRNIHHALEMKAFHLQRSGSSNILLSKLSFDCKITDDQGDFFREYITFDLRIPGSNSTHEAVYSYDQIKEIYGGEENLYRALEHFYQFGRGIANPENVRHGVEPNYNPNAAGHGQFIRHTEQLFVAYLALPEGVQMLCNRLRSEIRSKYPDAVSVKIYNMVWNMHSTKTCCAPCEYTLLGLMNDRNGFEINQIQLGFFQNFFESCAVPNEQLTFTFPDHSLFRLLITVSATANDGTHKIQPTYTFRNLDPDTPCPQYLIPVKNEIVSRHIYTVPLNNRYDQRIVPSQNDLADTTVGISGSRRTSGSPHTIARVNREREKQAQTLAEQMNYLGLEDVDD